MPKPKGDRKPRRRDPPAAPLIPLSKLRAIGERVRARTNRALADVAETLAAAEVLRRYRGRRK